MSRLKVFYSSEYGSYGKALLVKDHAKFKFALCKFPICCDLEFFLGFSMLTTSIYSTLSVLVVVIDWWFSLQVHIWMKKEDIFPKFGGRIDVKGLDFRISDAPAAFAVRVPCAFRVL